MSIGKIVESKYYSIVRRVHVQYRDNIYQETFIHWVYVKATILRHALGIERFFLLPFSPEQTEISFAKRYLDAN